MNFFQTFRARLILILAVLLIATLGVQYYVNLQTERANESLRKTQEEAIVGSVALVFASFKSKDDRIEDLISENGQRFFDEEVKKRIKDIIVIDNKWEVYDSLNEKYLPVKNETGEFVNVKLKNINDLPEITNADRLGDDIRNFPPMVKRNDCQAQAISIETSDQGRWYIIVILKADKNDAFLKAAQPLIYTMGILLVSILGTIFLVWRFTRPIAQLSNAAKKIAEGDLQVRVQGSERSDELGQLAMRFNEMTAELAKKEELEDKLQQSEKSAVVGRLASAIAHEIRNPLNYINLTLDHLRAKFMPAEEVKQEQFGKLTSQLKTEVERINHLVSEFLRYSRPLKLELVPTDLYQVINNSLQIVEGQAHEQEIEIKLNDSKKDINIWGDGEILRSVFNNLFLNAVQAMPNGGSLEVDVFTKEKSVIVEVKDTGQGIPTENLSKIFEPYFSTKETGTGLGLAIVKRIIEEHNATIEVTSKKDEGTKFTIVFQRAEQ